MKSTQQLLVRSAESANRRSKKTLSKQCDSIEQFKKSHKIVAKSLNADLLAVSEEESMRDEKESVDFGKELDDQKLIESPESLVLTPLALSTPLSTIEDAQEIDGTVTEFSGSSSKPENLDMRIVTDILRESRLQISNSSDVDLRSKKLLHALIKFMIDDFFGLVEEIDFLELL